MAALFKIHKGDEKKSDGTSRLPTSYVEGYAYFATDTGRFYIDTDNTISGRKMINPDAIVGINYDGSKIELTKVNGSTTTGANLYAPAYAGTAGQILLSSGESLAPYWADTSAIWTRGMVDETWANTAYVGRATTAAISLTQDSKLCWAIERTARNDNSLTAHFYNENGGWVASGKLLNELNYSDYALPLTGGTLTADPGTGTPLILKSGGPNATYLKFIDTNNTILGWFGFSNQDKPVISYGSTTTDYSILHSGNYSSYALPLTGGRVTGDIARLDDRIDVTLSNNGVASGEIYPTTYAVLDKNTKIVSRLETIINNTGTTKGFWYVRNYDSSGAVKTQKGIHLSVTKDNVFQCNIDGNTAVAGTITATSGTLTGSLTISNGQDLYLKAATGTDAGDIVFVKSDGSEYIRLWSQTGTNLLIRFGSSDSAKNIIHSGNYTDYTVTKTGSGASGTWGINITGSSASCTGNAATASSVAWSGITGKPSSYTPSSHTHSYAGSSSAGGAANSANWLNTNSALTYGASGLNYFNASLGTTASASSNYAPSADWYHIIRMNHANTQGYYVDLAACFHNDNLYIRRVAAGTNHGYKHVWVEGNSVTSAVWNDYAEYRESDCTEFGRVLAENGDDTLSATTERLQHFAGISSDTWGFCQGETEKAKTPIAVAGRVLAYTYQERNKYKPGDCVCAAPNGTVDIMTREEVMMYPDRIVGTISCIPDYEEWGQGDRPAVKVDGRIWIKVR